MYELQAFFITYLICIQLFINIIIYLFIIQFYYILLFQKFNVARKRQVFIVNYLYLSM